MGFFVHSGVCEFPCFHFCLYFLSSHSLIQQPCPCPRSAQTGSGKTAAFLLPIMERILQRGGGKIRLSTQKSQKQNQLAATRGLVLTPTRELAAQCLGMMNAMAKFTDLRASLIVGGARNINAQAAELRTRPDVIVATPGRLIDHLTNSSGVDLDDLEFLILDEADRLCEYTKKIQVLFQPCLYIYII